MSIELQSADDARIGQWTINEIEAAIAAALVTLLGDSVQIEIKKVVHWKDEVTGLDIAATIGREEQVFAFG